MKTQLSPWIAVSVGAGALKKGGVLFAEELILRSPAFVAQLLARQPRATAVFYWYDKFALLLLQALHHGGVRVPHEMALATLNNSHLTELDEVPITAVDLNNRGRARAAVQFLTEQIQQPGTPPRQILVTPSLVAWEFTAGRRG